MLQIRPYQTAAVDGVITRWYERDPRIANVLGIAPTGGGKTILYSMIIAEVLRRQPTARVVVLAHREELLQQGRDKFQRFIGDHISTGIIQASRNESMAQVVFASKDTIRQPKRLMNLLGWGQIDVLITDEAHHFPAASYRQIEAQLRAANPNLLHLGVTATPDRADNKTLGGIYDDIAFHIRRAELIEHRYLVPFRFLAVKTNISLRGVKVRAGDYAINQLVDVFETSNCLDLVIENHRDHADGRPFVAFTVSVAGAHALAEKFNAAGYKAAAIDGTMDKETRAQILRDFDSGALDGLTNCAVLTEGWDAPRIEAVHMARPTKSDGLWLQCIGRGGRPRNGQQVEDGETCIVFEYAPADSRPLDRIGRVLDMPPEVRKRLARMEDEQDAVDTGDLLSSLDELAELESDDPAGVGIVVQEINYLDDSPWTWQQQDGWLLLSLGAGRDDIKRILAISPERSGVKVLYAIYAYPTGRLDEQGRPTYKPWQCAELRPDDNHEALMDYANDLARQRGAPSLIDKKKAPRWTQAPASEAQRNMIRRGPFAAEADSPTLTKGAAAEIITLAIARQVLERAGVWTMEAVDVA